jgi:type I restriction enzyme S subunit
MLEDGLKWAASLPPGWSCEKLKHVADVSFSNVDKKTYDDGVPVRLCNYTDVYYNDFITSGMELMPATATQLEIERFSLQQHDVLVTKDSETPDDIAVPACVRDALEDVVCGYHLALLRCNPGRASGPFLLRALQASGVRDQFYATATGITRYGLGQQDIRDALIPLPPLATQRAIAAYLDRKTAAIDSLNEKKEKLIALLAEKRAALINWAVTKGLNPNVPMKDSGVPWIGEIPAHWKMARVRHAGVVDQGNTFPESLQGEFEGDLPWYKVKDMTTPGNEVEMGQAGNYVDESQAIARRVTVFPPGTIVFPRVGAALLTNKRRILRQRSVVDDNTYGFIPEAVTPRYSYYFFLQVDLASLCSSGLVPTVTIPAVKDLPMLVPPAHEQEAIGLYLGKLTSEADSLRSRLSLQVEQLTEYRQALITAAVTGQLDVPVEPDVSSAHIEVSHAD